MKNKHIQQVVGWCDKCDKDVVATVISQEKTLEVRDKKITAISLTARCVHCKTSVFNINLERQNDLSFYEKYKSEVGLLTANEIKRIREKYELTQVEFARCLSFGDKTIARYELGSIQDNANDSLMRLVAEPSIFARNYLYNRGNLSKELRVKIITKLLQLGISIDEDNDILRRVD